MNLFRILTSPKKYVYYFRKSVATLTGKIHGNGLKVYWWDHLPNSGDLVTPFLIKHYGFTPIHTWKNEATVVSCGSVLQNLPKDYVGYIIGSGILNAEGKVTLKHAKILAVRGELTRDIIGAPKDTPLGDPGLLVPHAFQPMQKKHYAVGIVPHYKDKNNPIVKMIKKRFPHDVKIIDIQRSVKTVLNGIAQCEHILSSSLHGLVFADALDIPCAWISLEADLSESKQFKYRDYHSALKLTREPIFMQGTETLSTLIKQTNKPSKVCLVEVKSNLDAVFTRFSQMFLSRK